MIKLLNIIIGLLFLTSCAEKKEGERKTGLLSNFISITDNEDKGIKEILKFYGGYCKYSVGISTSGNKYFELELSKSKIIDKQASVAQMPASNIAYLFFKNLKEERRNYDEIHSVLLFSDGQKITFKFPPSQLELVERRMNVVNKVVHLMKNKDFESLRLLLNDTAYVNYDKNELITKIKQVDPEFGNITEDFRPFGFRINQNKNGKNILHISGALIRDKQNNEFSIDLDLNADDNEIFLIQYKL